VIPMCIGAESGEQGAGSWESENAESGVMYSYSQLPAPGSTLNRIVVPVFTAFVVSQ
jgi:hypothetical protein